MERWGRCLLLRPARDPSRASLMRLQFATLDVQRRSLGHTESAVMAGRRADAAPTLPLVSPSSSITLLTSIELLSIGINRLDLELGVEEDGLRHGCRATSTTKGESNRGEDRRPQRQGKVEGKREEQVDFWPDGGWLPSVPRGHRKGKRISGSIRVRPHPTLASAL